MNYMELIGALLVLAGSIFLLLASVGLLRMPDFYTRIQTSTKASTLGTILIFMGIGFLMPGWIGKVVTLILFVLITNPISSHVLARAAHHIGIPLTPVSVADDLKRDNDQLEQTDNANK
ncbi:MAG TPA: monovalent cation/H(+) antiporter subunit G [Williamwhitmania sp.]|nr:monovalent cation/H(+) antiporter subunit G [Williamwhitmania sp.]